MSTEHSSGSPEPNSLPSPAHPAVPRRHILVGYWHNWHSDKARFIPLRDISPDYDIVHVAFAVSTPSADGRMVFIPDASSPPSQFRSDVAYLQENGRKVVLSVGGANGSPGIDNEIKEHNFVSSLIRIIEEYGFDGVDINLEKNVRLEDEDRDFAHPSSPSILHLISAIRSIRRHFSPFFILSLAPETIMVQGGFHHYGGASGAYLPLIHGLRDLLTYVNVQDYNSNPMMALDGRTYAQGRADFHVAMIEMLLQGFPVEGDAQEFFPPLPPEQVVVGLPASTCMASDGYTPPQEVEKALEYLMKGRSFGGGYVLRQARGYLNIRGLMTWSINWDAEGGRRFSRFLRERLDSLP